MRLVTKDQMDSMPLWRKIINILSPLSSLIAISLYWLYFALRVLYTISAQQATHRVFVLSWIFVVVEMAVISKFSILIFRITTPTQREEYSHMLVTVPTMLRRILQYFISKTFHNNKLRIISDFTPTVDVFVTCFNEDNDMILNSVRTTLGISWPISRFRVIVLDDGASSFLKAEIRKLSKTFPNLYYTARKKAADVPHYSKAGNLNHGLRFVQGLKGGAGEFCASLNSDTIPEPDWLRATIAHLVIDPDMALACPPQVSISRNVTNVYAKFYIAFL